MVSFKNPSCSKVRLFFAILLLCFYLSPIKCQSDDNDDDDDDSNERSLSTAIAGMELLLETELKLLLHLENYANALETKAIVIRSAIAAMRAENLKSVDDAEEYLSNPLNSYALIRRTHTDWIYWELFMESPVGEAEIEMIKKQRAHLPTSTDLDEASAAIYRLQTTYDLKPAEMAAGLLNGKQYNASFSARDCFAIGNHLFSEDQVYDAGLWLYTTLQLYQENDVNVVLEFDKLKILELYAETFLRQNRFSDAMSVIDAAIQQSPNNAKYLRTKSVIELEMKTSKEKPIRISDNFANSYERCCRGEFDYNLSRLHCRYNTTTHPFLKLAPLKMEELQMDPYMVLYHDVISDAEIDELKELARPVLERAKVFQVVKNRTVPIKGRTSKFSSFGEDLSNATKRINQRITDMSGFDLSSSEMLQVINYGLGGHYDTHYDFFNLSMDSEIVRLNGDRVATVLFYMTDVSQGGATVFPNIKIAVYPRKGTAVMWYNLNSRGEGDYRTLHAACPVIVGSKWICNMWIRERDQLFRRPCNKEQIIK